jgi:hypothetical protein
MTITMLLANTVQAAERAASRQPGLQSIPSGAPLPA